MKTTKPNRFPGCRSNGSVLLMALIAAAILIPLIWVSVYMISTQQRTVAMAQNWNAGVPVVEAGIEEAFAHLNRDCLIDTNARWSGTNEWVATLAASGDYEFSVPRRTLANGAYYDVKILTNGGDASERAPVIICMASVPTRVGVRAFTNAQNNTAGPMFATVGGSTGGLEIDRGTNTYIARQIRVQTSRASWADFGLLGFGNVGVSGTVRSFDSAGSSSYWGHYLPGYAEDDAVIGSLYQNIDLHPNAAVYGGLQTSADGSASGGTVGDTNWFNGGNTGIQPGHYSNDLDFPDPTIPEDPSLSEMQSWFSLTAYSPALTQTYTNSYMTNGAWVTTTNLPFMSPPGGFILTNTNDVFYSSTYYPAGSYPGPPLDTYYFTNTVTGSNNVPIGATVLNSWPVNAQWNSNIQNNQTVPAQSPPVGTYLTSIIGSAPSGYAYIESPGVYVFVRATNWYRNCTQANSVPTTSGIPYYGSVTSGSSAGNCNGSGSNIGGQRTIFSYNHIYKKSWQVAANTNYMYYTPTNYLYAMTTYSYYGPQTNNLVVTDKYVYVATGGDRQIGTLSLSGQEMMLIKGGKNRIYLPSGFSITGKAKIVIEPGSSVEFYCGGNIDIGGNGISNTGDKASNLAIYGLPTCTSISLSGNARFTGTILAPEADLTINGGGARGLIIGAITANTITMHGNPVDFVYDQDVRRHMMAYFYATAWREEKPTP